MIFPRSQTSSTKRTKRNGHNAHAMVQHSMENSEKVCSNSLGTNGFSCNNVAFM